LALRTAKCTVSPPCFLHLSSATFEVSPISTHLMFLLHYFSVLLNFMFLPFCVVVAHCFLLILNKVFNFNWWLLLYKTFLHKEIAGSHYRFSLQKLSSHCMKYYQALRRQSPLISVTICCCNNRSSIQLFILSTTWFSLKILSSRSVWNVCFAFISEFGKTWPCLQLPVF
jgi:hypothetical protein